MASIEKLGTGWIDERDSAFPQAVQLPDGDIVCSFTVGGGPGVTGGTDWARSTDGGENWNLEGTIVGPTAAATAILKLTLSPDGNTIYAYGVRSYRNDAKEFGTGRHEPIICRSTDGGHTWTEPTVIPVPTDCGLEISHGALPLSSGRLLAPFATLPAKRLGEQVILMISDDGGNTWPRHTVALEDPDNRFGYFEQKFAEISPGRVIGICWTVSFGDVVDQPDSFVLSEDAGETWSRPVSTGIMGQTMTPIPLGNDRLLVLYNRRQGDQGVVMSLVSFTEDTWSVHYEAVMYDPNIHYQRPDDVESGVDEFETFMFGFPTAIRLTDGTFLATHWCKEDADFGIRWTKLSVDW